MYVNGRKTDFRVIEEAKRSSIVYVFGIGFVEMLMGKTGMSLFEVREEWMYSALVVDAW